MSWAQPTAQYGHTPGTTLASLIRSEVAAASTGARLTPRAPSATPVADVPEYFRNSRRERLMGALLCATASSVIASVRSELGAGDLLPDAPEHHDRRDSAVRFVDAYDVSGIQRAERRLDTVFGDHDGAFVTGEIGAALTFDAQAMVIGVDRHHRDSALLEPIREALRHGPDPPSAWSTRSRCYGSTPIGPAAGRVERSDHRVKNSIGGRVGRPSSDTPSDGL